MSTLSIEMLIPERVTALWPQLEPYFAAACAGNEIANDEMTADDVYTLALSGMAVIFAGFEDGELACVIGVQFNTTGERLGADIIAMAGRNLMRFKAAYWGIIVEWLKANGVMFIDAYAPDRLAKIYLRKFGFTKSCTYVRMSLQGDV